ncbi:hypothetical protein CMUS01_09673 [Colletotrichum musicola]|uniref:Uncharacterized protein n=1 Tax=Colletotrichum musicola TaxID=2175873 RepID=A0A8H6K6U5_9PEZI|nr:hypothetical protein CMUS01_09673 [Colletotrichum musicola]
MGPAPRINPPCRPLVKLLILVPNATLFNLPITSPTNPGALNRTPTPSGGLVRRKARLPTALELHTPRMASRN